MLLDSTIVQFRFRRPMVWLALIFSAGVLLGVEFPEGRDLLKLFSALFFVAAIAPILLRKKSLANIMVGCAIACTGSFLGARAIKPAFSPDHLVNFIERRKVVVRGRLYALPRYGADRTFLQIDVNGVMPDKAWRPSEGKLQITVRKACPYLKYGDEIEAKVKLSEPFNIKNPGAFDYGRYMAAQRIFVTGYMSDGKDIALLNRSAGGPKAWIENARQDISRRIHNLGDGSAEAEVLKALLLGERSAVPEDVNKSFARAGVAHLLAVSGLHLGIVASLAFWILLWVLKLSERLMLAVNVRRLAAILTLLPVAVYAELTGARIPTMRAAVMVSVYLIAVAIGRGSDLRSSIALAAAVLLSIWPASITDAGFLLSFTAVIAIAEVIPVLDYRYPIVDPINPTRRRRLWREYIIFPLTIGIAILVSTAPMTARLFNQFQYLSPISNLIFIPLVGYLVLSLGLVSLMLHPIWPMLGNWLLYLDLRLTKFSIVLIDWFAQAPGANRLVSTPSVFAVVMCFILVLSLLRILGPPDPSRRIARVLVALAIAGLALDAGAGRMKKDTGGAIEATFLDAGDGNSALILSPAGKAILIDIGKEFVSSYFLYRHVPKIDVVAITHPHDDHIGGLNYLLENFQVGEIWMADAAYPQYMTELVTKPAQSANVPIKKLAQEDPPFRYGDVSIDILWPPRGYKPPEIPYPDINSASLVLRMSAGGVSIIFPGDIRTDIQDEITSERKMSRSTVMLAPHHGAKGSLSENFLRFVNPRLVVVSARWSNRRPYPNVDVLNLIAGSGIKVMRTDEDGAVQVRGDGDKLEVSHWTGNKWKTVEIFESSR